MTKVSVAIQGQAGSFHEAAAREMIEDAEVLPCRTFADVFDAVESEQANYGVVAIENSLHGSINQVYRLLAQRGLWICGEARLKIELYLYSCLPRELTELNSKNTVVISQAEALSQCEAWLNQNLPVAQRKEYEDTAASVQLMVNTQDPHMFAIASRRAGEIHQAELIAGPINDDLENFTRFVLLSKQPITNRLADRTSIIITEQSIDKPGTLLAVLQSFEKYHVNLSKLDSHPIPGEQRRYAFYLDFDAGVESPEGQAIIAWLKQSDWKVNILGSYPSQKLASQTA